MDFPGRSIGGGGGNRTRVRKSSAVRPTYLAWSFGSRLAPAGRQADAQPVASTDARGQATKPRTGADVNDAALLSGAWSISKPVQRLAGIRRLERNARRWRLRISRWIYEVTGPRHALRCFETCVETKSPPGDRFSAPRGAENPQSR